VKRDAPRDVMVSAGTAHAVTNGAGESPASGVGMGPQFRAHLAFHLTGHRISKELDAFQGRSLRPALLAGYRDLTQLRYDFPLVLTSDSSEKGWVRSVSDIVDDLLRQIAPRGFDGEKTRRSVLRLESAMRKRLTGGAAGSLLSLWDQSARGLASPSGEPLAETLSRARAALKENGEVIDCDEALPGRLFVHAWKAVQARKARSLREEIDRLVLKLSDILKADFARSAAGRSSEQLRASVGRAHEQAFDFDAMSRLLARNAARETLPESRRQRINRVLGVLQSQRFVRPGGRDDEPEGAQLHGFVFETCTDALATFRSRLPELIELVKAIATAELEIEGRYIEPAHDSLFEQFDEDALGPKDLRLFPDYLVCIRSAEMRDSELKTLIDVLASGLPIKVLVQTDDLLPPLTSAGARFALNVRSMRLASMALGLGDVFVLQSSASNLYQAREHIYRGLAQTGPALFSVYAGATRSANGFPPYLAAAAAMQSRAFPAFAYDPAAGRDWAARFSLDRNAQAGEDWPVERFAYEDEAHQRIEEKLAFTFVDFVACDPRYAAHFAVVPRADWNESMVPLARALADETGMMPNEVPYLLMVDEQNRLQRAIVHDKLILAARRCGEMWRSLQELGGIRSSQAEKLLARERKVWEEAKQKEIEALWREAKAAAPAPAVSAPVAGAPAPAAPAPATAEAAEPEAPSDEPYIETPRCTTCNECTNLNNRLFVYDANKQAYIADINAGTYRELVEAAESCQVSIIHPGKPRNPKEPGLDELMKRAAPFM
jgi:ADP-ribose pyrophosphatase YjhB (NUDIX family)